MLHSHPTLMIYHSKYTQAHLRHDSRHSDPLAPPQALHEPRCILCLQSEVQLPVQVAPQVAQHPSQACSQAGQISETLRVDFKTSLSIGYRARTEVAT